MKKILFMSDSPVLDTGFGRVMKEISIHMANSGEWKIRYVGWFHNNDHTKDFFPFDIIQTDNNDRMDKYGIKTFERVVSEFKPDVVFTLGDEWMVRHVASSEERSNFRWICYVPIDSGPILKEWVETFKKADVVVACTNFGKGLIKAREPSQPVSVIPHGVDTTIYNKMPCKPVLPKIPSDSYLIGMVGRNQPRKMIPRLLKMMKLFISPWFLCANCDSFSVIQGDNCPSCGVKYAKKWGPKENVYLYMHCSDKDFSGWNLSELVHRFGLQTRVVYPKNNLVGKGVPDKVLAEIYNRFDVFTLPTQGEGFGIPILEAMACGVPTVVTNYSGHLDFCGGISELIKVSEFITQPRTNQERAVVDLYDYVMRMDKLYYNKSVFIDKWGNYIKKNYPGVKIDDIDAGRKLRKKISDASLYVSKAYDWNNLFPIWDELFNKTIDIKEFEYDKKENISLRSV